MTESKQELLSTLNENFNLLEPNDDAKRVFERINFSKFPEEQIRDFGYLFTHCLASMGDYFGKKIPKEILKTLEHERKEKDVLIEVGHQQAAEASKATMRHAETRMDLKEAEEKLVKAEENLEEAQKEYDGAKADVEKVKARNDALQNALVKLQSNDQKQPALTQREAAIAFLRGMGNTSPTEKEIKNTQRRIRAWEAFTRGKGGNRPLEGYPGLHCSVLEFCQWASKVNMGKSAKRALRNTTHIRKDVATNDETSERDELAEIARTGDINKVRKALDSLG